MTEYYATARASTTPFAPSAVSLTASTNTTVLQVGVPSTTDIMVLGWGVSFNGAAGGTQVPVTCWLADDGAAASVGTSYTPDNWGNAQAPASLCVGGAALTAFGCTTFGTPATLRMLDSEFVSPQVGYGVLWPDDRQPRVGVSRFLKVNCNAPATVSVIPWVLWAEPAV